MVRLKCPAETFGADMAGFCGAMIPTQKLCVAAKFDIFVTTTVNWLLVPLVVTGGRQLTSPFAALIVAPIGLVGKAKPKV